MNQWQWWKAMSYHLEFYSWLFCRTSTPEDDKSLIEWVNIVYYHQLLLRNSLFVVHFQPNSGHWRKTQISRTCTGFTEWWLLQLHVQVLSQFLDPVWLRYLCCPPLLLLQNPSLIKSVGMWIRVTYEDMIRSNLEDPKEKERTVVIKHNCW